MMVNSVISKFKKNSFFEKKNHFVNVDTDPRLWITTKMKRDFYVMQA
jgi:hypothetical protein